MSALTLLQATEADIISTNAELVFGVILFALYSGVLLLLGLNGYRKTEVLNDYAIGGGRLKAWWIGLSFGVTYASANMFIGVPGFAYSAGTPALWWIAVFTGLPFIGIALISKRFYEIGGLGGQRDLTLPDWLGNRFDSPFLRIATGIISLLLAFYVAGQIIGAGTLFERIFGLPYAWGIGLSITIAAVYVAGGGMRSTILTDLLQSIIMMLIAVIVFFSGIWVFGVNFLGNAVRAAAAEGANTGWFTTETLPALFGGPIPVASIAWLGLAFILLPHLLNRVLAVQNKRELREFVLFSGIGLFFCSAFMQWIGLYAYALNPNLEFADAAVPAYLAHAFPNVVAITITVGLISAILTTTDSLLQGVAAIVGNDVYKYGVEAYWRGNVTPEEIKAGETPQAVERRSVWAARAGVVLTAAIALYIAMARPSHLTIITQMGITGLLSGVTAPLLAGYLWRECSQRAAEAAFVAGFGSYLVLFVGGIIDSFFVVYPISTVISFAVLVVITLAQSDNNTLIDRWDRTFATDSGDDDRVSVEGSGD